MKKYKAARKKFKESKDKAKAVTIADKLAQSTNDANSSPVSLTASPNKPPGSEGSALNSNNTSTAQNRDTNEQKRKIDGDHSHKSTSEYAILITDNNFVLPMSRLHGLIFHSFFSDPRSLDEVLPQLPTMIAHNDIRRRNAENLGIYMKSKLGFLCLSHIFRIAFF